MSEFTAEVTLLSEAITADPNFERKFWSAKMARDARNRNPFKPLIGGEGSGMPICEKSEKVEGGQTITFTSTAPLMGRGRMGEQSLKDHTNKLEFGTYSLTVGLRMNAITHHELLNYLRLRKDNVTAKQLANEMNSAWWGDMEATDIEHVLLRIARLVSPRNLKRVNNRASRADLTLSDTLQPGGIEYLQSALIRGGARPIAEQSEMYGGRIPEYLLYTTWDGANSLWDNQEFRDVVQNAGVRGDKNAYFSNMLPKWKDMCILRNNVVNGSQKGRLGTPCMPYALLGKAIPDASSVDITGGGSYNSDASLTDVALYDFFANFEGFGWSTYENESLPADNGTYHAILYNSYDGKYEGISYTAASNNGNKLASAGVTREVATILPTTHARYSNVHNTATGEVYIIPCTVNGVPLGWSIGMGQEALLLGKGSFDARPIYQEDEYGHFKSYGIDGIRGYTSPQNTVNQYPNFQVLEHAVEIPGVELVDMS